MTTDPTTDTDTEKVSQSERDLCVEFELLPAKTCSCPLTGIEGEVIDIRQQLTNDTCYTDTTVRSVACQCRNDRDCAEIVHTESGFQETCPCGVFSALGCIPRFTEISEDCVRIETYLPNREVLTKLVEELRMVVEELHLCRLKRVESVADRETPDSVTLELNELTDKQREAATRAVTAGYYSTPRAVSLGDLAEDLDISKSALSQRLNAVESKLATSAFAEAATED